MRAMGSMGEPQEALGIPELLAGCRLREAAASRVWSSFPAPWPGGTHRVRAKGGAGSRDRPAPRAASLWEWLLSSRGCCSIPRWSYPRHLRPWDTDLSGFVTKHCDTKPVPQLGEGTATKNQQGEAGQGLPWISDSRKEFVKDAWE